MNDAARPALPAEAEVIVVGGGTAGAAGAARLVEGGKEVLVLEAGPDPGPLGSPDWPADLVDATRLGTSYDWGFDSAATYPDQVVKFERSRVLGGCSAHNGAVQTWGHRADYDGWAEYAGPGWSTDELLPYFARATEQLKVFTYERGELTPWQEAWLSAWVEGGLPLLDDLNGLDETVGVAPESVNIVDGVRFNSAFAYLDPIRGDERLTICGDALVDKLILAGDKVAGVVAIRDGAPVEVRSPLVILCGGTFLTPTVLLRSGIGPAADLRALGIDVVVDSPGVGANLHDQPFVLMSWEGSAEMGEAMAAAAAAGWAPDEQVMAKCASSFDPDVFDVHILPYSPTHLFDGRSWHAGAGCLLPRSRGDVKLGGTDPEALPLIDHGFYTDPEGHDVAVLAEGVAMMRELAATPGLRDVLGAEKAPGPVGCETEAEIAGYLRSHVDSYWHPVGTAKMGPESDPTAVADHTGAVRGIEGCMVADCALMPVIPRATTAMPAVVIGERVAAFALEGK
ncbi:MAG: GMC family oxidoreductase [Solirubrobacterales bacterium]